jgi:hypothetical protein
MRSFKEMKKYLPLSLIIFVNSSFLYINSQSFFRGFKTECKLHIPLIYKPQSKRKLENSYQNLHIKCIFVYFLSN